MSFRRKQSEIQRDLRSPKYKQRVVVMKTLYKRHLKHKKNPLGDE
jgi:hypothetical protein